jgi:hypothetical protein
MRGCISLVLANRDPKRYDLSLVVRIVEIARPLRVQVIVESSTQIACVKKQIRRMQLM